MNLRTPVTASQQRLGRAFPQPPCDICPCAQPTIRFIIVPTEVVGSPQHRQVVPGTSARKSHVFKILTYKSFVVNILQGISRIEVRKSLILDILQNRGGGGVG